MKQNLFAVFRALVLMLPLSLGLVSCEGFDWEDVFGGVTKPETDSVATQSVGYYQIPEKYLGGWDEGIITSDKHYLVMKADTASNGYICYMNDSASSTLGLAAYLDAEFNVTTMMFSQGVMLIDWNDVSNSAYVSFIDSTGSVVFEDEIDVSTMESSMYYCSTTRSGGTMERVALGTIKGYGILNNLGTLGDAVAGDWDSALKGLGADLVGGLIGSIVGGLPGAVAGVLIGEFFNGLKNMGDGYQEDAVRSVLGSSKVEIVEMQRTSACSYNIKVDVSNLSTRPLGQVTGKQSDVKVGLYFRENFRTVNKQYKTGESAMYPIVVDGTVEIPLTVDDANGVYYVVPVLLPYRGTVDITGCMRYGTVKKLEGDIFDIQSIDPGKCAYDSKSEDYAFDVEICASVLCPDDVRSWGIDLYVWRYTLSMDDILSEKIGTIDYPLSSSPYSLKFEGHLSANYLDESNDCFNLRAIPFAVTDDNEKIEGTPETFVVELSNNSCSDANHVHAVDLGLSVKWACCNVGASSPEGYGGYYAWGETEEKSSYYWEDYKYYNSSTGGLDNIGSNISGTSYDVAHVKWGGSWRMPTKDEIRELVNKCSWEWTSVNGVNGQKVTGPNGNSIFLPAAGNRDGTELYRRGSDGLYWSGTLGEDYSNGAYGLRFGSGRRGWSYYYRSDGFSVRPVTE